MASNVILFLGASALMFALSDRWPLPVAAVMSLVGALLSVAVAQRLALFGAGRPLPVGAVALALLRTPQRVRDGVAVLAAALDVRARAPAFIRLRLRPSSPRGLAAVTQALSASPGMVAVDADPGSLLAHVLHEGDVSVAALQNLERAAVSSIGETS